ncbi:MAG: cation transporter [Acidimicrobiales bacterium]|nr:cation transporter [Acidimicrobiales bacterium]
MSTKTFTVAGMSCDHCVRSVTEAVRPIAGVASVGVDLESGVVTVESGSEIDSGAVADAIGAAGYEVVA